MKTYILKFDNGDVGELREFDGEGWACPICGTIWERFPPYYPNDGALGHMAEFSGPNLGEVCEGCEIEFGVEFSSAPTAPRGFTLNRLKKLRTQWLDGVGWDIAALNQLESRLCISEKQARQDADEVRRAK